MGLPLFDSPIPVYDPEPSFLRDKAIAPRLSRQCAEMLALLQRGPATNRELSAIALKYNARISELRAAKFNVVCVSEDRKTGLAVYELQESR